MVGAESIVCPRCGVNFKAALIRKIVIRIGAVLLLAWVVWHFVLRKPL
jgi:hypothetical protein